MVVRSGVAFCDHVEHRADPVTRVVEGIGRPAVVSIIAGAFLLGVCVTHLVISPELWNSKALSNVAQAPWALGLFCLSFGLAATAVHKERQVELGIGQIRDSYRQIRWVMVGTAAR